MNDLIVGRDGWKRPVRVPGVLRFRHAVIVGKTGKGKSALEHRLIHQDVKQAHATIVFDAGDLGRRVLEALPERAFAEDRVRFFSVTSVIPFNPLRRRRDEPARVEAELFGVLDQVTVEGSATGPLSARMKALLSIALREVLRDPAATLSDLVTYLTTHRTALKAALGIHDDEFPKTWDAVRDRLRFLRDPRVRRVLCTTHELDFGQFIDQGKIVIISLAGLEPALVRLLGTVLFSALQSVIFERDEEDRRDVTVVVDEFGDFVRSHYATDMFQKFYSQGRRYRISLAVAHQDWGTLPAALLETIYNNAGTVVAFGTEEGVRLSPIFAYRWPPEALSLLADYEAIARVGESIHHLETYPPPTKVADRWQRLKSEPLPPDPPDPFDLSLDSQAHRDAPTIRKPRAPKPTVAA